MEIKAKLEKPYTSQQRTDFIVQNNHRLGYEIKETEEELQAWGKTDEELLAQAKEAKNSENTTKAKQAVEDGYVIYKEAEFETNDGTGQKLNSKRELCITRGEISTMWLSKDDKAVELKIDTENPKENDDFVQIGFLVEAFSNVVWMEKYIGYKQAIELAETLEEVNNIIIDYDIETINVSLQDDGQAE